MKINLNNKIFKSEINSTNGEVSSETIFQYKQDGNIIWAEYKGGQIVKGFLIGKIVENHFEFTYQHLNIDFELMTGKCKSYPEIMDNEKLRIKEIWEWTCKDFSSGESTIIEV